MADLAALRELHAWMRDARVSYARCGELELRIELPAPPPVQASGWTPAEDEDADERRALETLLHSAGVEADPFLRAMKKVA